MKKLFAMLLALTLVLSLVACAGNNTTTGKTETTTTGKTETTTTGKTETPTTGSEPTKATEPEATKPEATDPEATDPEATDPEATDPEATDPEATEPEATDPEATDPEATDPEATDPEATDPEATEPKADYMTYEEYMAAEIGAEVVIEAYVQAHQSWWENKVTVYAQDPDGAYFIYELACSEEDAAKLTSGTKIRVTGYKDEWSGEVEIIDATFEFVESEPWIATAFDATALLGTDDLVKHQNEFVSFKGLTIVSVSYKNDEPGSDDIYVTVSYNGQNYDFCVEYYLTNAETEVYKAFAGLSAGDVVDIEGFLYWYNGVNTHITSVTKVN